MLIKLPTEMSQIKFEPLCFTKHGMNYQFFVERDSVAFTLEKLDKQIFLYGTNESPALSIRIYKSPPPKISDSEDVWDQVKLVMSSRYHYWKSWKKCTVL